MSAMVTNPLVAAVQSRLAQLQGGAAPASDPGNAANANPDIGDQLAQQSSELHGADPALGLKQLQRVRQALGVLFIQYFQAIPSGANKISKVLATMDQAISEFEKASQVASAVRPPVGFDMAKQGAGFPGGAPQQAPS